MQRDTHKYTILIIEDNPGDFFLVSEHLEEEIAAPKIYHAESFVEARRMIQEHRHALDIILMDLTLPDISGEALLTEMLHEADELPLVVLTGYADLNFAKKSLSMGASDYLIKDSLNATVLYKSVIYNLERHKYLKQILDSEQRYSDLFHLSPQPLWVEDAEIGKFLDVNEAALRQYEYSFNEFETMSTRDLLATDAHGPTAGLIDHNHDRQYLRHRTKSGRELIVDLQSNDITYYHRAARITLATDITSRINYIRAIENQNKKLKDIAWHQSHVVRAPLSRMMGLINLLELPTMDERDRADVMQKLVDSAYELDGIIHQIVEKTQAVNIQES